VVEHEAKRKRRHKCERYRRCVAKCDRNQRQQHGAKALTVQSQRDGKQPTHSRVDAMKESEPG
jgi:hypothetical protein